MRLQHFIDRLERFAASRGITVQRTALGPWVLGQMQEKHVVMRCGLSKEQQLLTLIHELTHILVHSDDRERLNRTVCEYEAEAVERLVAGQLGLKHAMQAPLDLATATDDLLASSVARVRVVARVLFNAARGEAPSARRECLETQAAVEI
jgi:hypothetical protein